VITLHDLAAAWNGFFFAPVSVYPVAVFRIFLGLILLADGLFILRNAELYLGPQGLTAYHRNFLAMRGRALSLFLYLPGTMRSVYLVLALHLTAVALMTVGFLTPVSTALAFVTTRSIVNRSWPSANGGDNVAKIMCFLLIFAPAGRALSLDEVLFYAPNPPDGSYLMAEPWAQRLMQIQVSVIYLYTVYWKLKGATWREGSAVYYAVTNNMYRKFPVPRFLMKPLLIKLVTWGVLAAEVAIGIGLWIEDLRLWLVFLGLALHLAIETFLSVHLFGWYMLAGLCLFLDFSWLRALT
jgi:hypothetical protein